MTKKNVLVTGAAGFIGSYVCKALLLRGDTVVAIDNFNDYYDPALKEARAAQLAKLGLPIERRDLCDPGLDHLLRQHSITHVVHLAAQAGVRYSLSNPHAYIHSNISGFLNILEACRQIPDLRLTYASSSSVYGLNSKIPFSVDDRTDAQASLYGVTKKSNELMARTYHHLYGLHCTGLRFFTVYGPWGRPDMAYYSFAEKILKGMPIDLYNHGDMRRDFTYIDDIVDGTLRALDRCDGYHLYNLGNHQPVALGRFVELLEQGLGRHTEKRYLGMQPGDVKETFADVDLSRRDLGWEAKTSIEDGLAKFIDWFVHKFQ